MQKYSILHAAKFLLLGIFCCASIHANAETNVVHFRLPHPTALRLFKNYNPKAEWLKSSFDDTTNIVELGNRIVIQITPGADLKKLTAGRAAILDRTITPNVFILQAPDALTAIREAEFFATLPQVITSYPVMRQSAALHGPYAARPNDTYYFAQWNLENRMTNGFSGGVDLNVRAAWPFSRGEGVTLAVADVGVELSHPELSNRTVGAPHFNFDRQNTNGLPFGRSAAWAHGTEVSGLAVGEMGNLRGMAGVAPKANVASWVIFTTNQFLVSDEKLMDMYQFASNTVAVQNHSWGHVGLTLRNATLLEQIGISNAVFAGRSGRGVVLVRSAGNDRLSGANCNDDGYPSDPRVIAVAAIRIDGRIASYSEPGACVLVSAPSGDSGLDGLFTTDLLGADGVDQLYFCPPSAPHCPYEDLPDYVFNSQGFSGTSAAAPQIAGVAALMLSANPLLTYRDVQQILIFSSRQFDFADPDLTTNGAGFRVSHNSGFGVPDAGVAVTLARQWSNRPPATNITFTTTNVGAIPDDGLRLIISGTSLTNNSIRTLPSTGIQPDLPTSILPLVNVGQATNVLAQNLTNKAALIQRGGTNANGGATSFAEKINRAAAAGAAFAVVYNSATSDSGCPGGDQLCNMGATDYVPIPAVFIGYSDGSTLTNLLQLGTNVMAQLKLQTTNYSFNVTNTLICEHVGVRVKTDHPLRGDLRITLVSPQGTRSVLQSFNGDTSAGPVDWTYYSTHHFLESSAGTWSIFFGDESGGSAGNVQSLSLTLEGVPITDVDADGLDDNWEITYLGSLGYGPKDDPDNDGYSNSREQIMRTNPLAMDTPFQLDLSRLDKNLLRLSWPGSDKFNYEIRSGTNVANLNSLTNLAGKFPETEWITPYTNSSPQFFQVRSVPKP